MLDVDEEKFRRWVNLTQQQYDIVRIIYRLRNRGIQPTPKNIQREYKNETNKYLMKPNLFNILRTLQEKKIVCKNGQADYSLDQDGIRKALADAKTKLTADIEELNKTHRQVDQFFRELTYRKEQPEIHYLEGEDLYKTLANCLDKSSTFYTVSDFPTVAYSREMTYTLQQDIYADKLWDVLKNRKTQVKCLTDLNIDSIFNHAFRTYGDPKTAYRESINATEKINTKLEAHRNLEIRYTDAPHGLDVAIVQTREPVEFIMFTRDEQDEIQGGIMVRSLKTAVSALRTFKSNFDYATPLNTPQGQQILEKTKKGIKQKYGVLGV